jgi:NAD(P)H-hydrate epimerase
MRLPAPLLRHNLSAHKNNFGHALILAGSARMLGAAALTCDAAMRAGAGLVTLGIAKSLNLTAQRKISSMIMTLPLKETKEQSLSLEAYPAIKKEIARYAVLALGPGLSQHRSTRELILKMISSLDKPMIIDADALNALAENPSLLRKIKTPKIITPHPGEMSRLTTHSTYFIERHRKAVAEAFAKTYGCIVILKGHKTIVASPNGKTYINKTGNVGMATAGSGDVLTGILAAFLAQEINSFETAKLAVFLHGKAGDIAARQRGKVSLVATDIIESLPLAFKNG